MKIKSIEPHLLSCPMPEPVYPFHGGKEQLKRDAMVVASPPMKINHYALDSCSGHRSHISKIAPA